MTLISERTREHDMAVQYGACRVADRILLIIALHEHRIESGDGAAPLRAVPGTLDELRQLCKNRRRITFGHRRLANRERDLALRHRIARERIHDEKHVLALIAEILGD